MIRNIFVSSTLAVVMAVGATSASAGILSGMFNKYEITLPEEAVNKVLGVKLEDVVNNYSNSPQV